MPARAKLPPGEGKRTPLNMRTTRELRERLEREAADSGRSLAQEVEFRLERSLQEQEAFFDAANHLVEELLAGRPEEERGDASILKEKIKVALRKFVHKAFDRRPMILPIVIDVWGAEP